MPCRIFELIVCGHTDYYGGIGYISQFSLFIFFEIASKFCSNV